jgi:predicted RND superfamily exporter protein
MTSVTTAGGLLSFLTADVEPVAEFGLITSVGVMLVFIYTVVLLPALLALFPLAKPSHRAERRSTVMDRLLEWIASFSCRNYGKIILASALLMIFAFVGMSRLYFSHNALLWFPDSNPIRVATQVIDEKLAGSISLEVVIDTGKTNGLYDPVLLQHLSDSVKYCENLKETNGTSLVGKAWSLDTIVKEINRALNENREEFYRIPKDHGLVAQELFLFEGTGNDDLEETVDADFSKVRFTLKAPYRDAFEYQPMVEKVRQHFQRNYPDANIAVTGEMALIVQLLINVMKTMATSYAISLVVITLLMIMLIGRVRIGMLSMVPNLLPLFLVAGMMGFFKIPLDFSSMLTGSIAIGLVVDDTIHFMHNFRRYFEQSGDVVEAVHQTMLTTGRAMLVTSVVLSRILQLHVRGDEKHRLFRSHYRQCGRRGTDCRFFPAPCPDGHGPSPADSRRRPFPSL